MVSPRLSEATLARMGATADQHLDGFAAILRATTTRGPQGPVTTWAPVAGLEAVPCSVAPGGRQPVESAVATGSPQARMTWTVTLPRHTDVRSPDRILVDGRTFEVVGPQSPRTYELQTDVICLEVK